MKNILCLLLLTTFLTCSTSSCEQDVIKLNENYYRPGIKVKTEDSSKKIHRAKPFTKSKVAAYYETVEEIDGNLFELVIQEDSIDFNKFRAAWEIASKILNVNPGGSYFNSNMVEYLPGDTILIPAGTYGSFSMDGLNGTQANPIVIKAMGDVSIGVNSNPGWNFYGNTSNVVIDGENKITVRNVNGFGMNIESGGNFTVRGVIFKDISMIGLKYSTVPFGAPDTPDPSKGNLLLEDLSFSNIGQENIYAGRDELGGTFINGIIRRIKTRSSGRDGIQCRNGTFIIEDCDVDNPGTSGDANHNHGYLIGGNTKNSTIRRCIGTRIPNFGIFINGWGNHVVECNNISSGNSALFTKNFEASEDLQNVGYQTFDVNNNTFTNSKSIEMNYQSNGKSISGEVTSNKTTGSVSVPAGVFNGINDASVVVNCVVTIPSPVIPPVDAELKTKTLRSNLNFPWEVLWGYDGKLWITERGGKISRLNPVTGATEFSQQIADVVTNNEGGMLGMVQHPDFLNNGIIYVVYNYNKNGSYTEKVVRYRFTGTNLADATTIIDDIAANSVHNGSRLYILVDKLFITTGDANNTSNSTSTSSKNGKTLRINLDGSIPSDNPVPGNPMWSLGHRNAQGMVVANGIMYQSEHGPNTEDEINIIEKNINYGWPNKPSGSRSPIWNTPNNTLAVCGLDYYNSNGIPQWKNSLLLTTLKDATLHQFKLTSDGKGIVSRTEFFRGSYGRLRDVAVSPTGVVYMITSNGGGNDKIIEIKGNTIDSTPPPPPPPPVDTIPTPPPTTGLKDTALFNLNGVSNRVFKKLRFTNTTTAIVETQIIKLTNCSNITFDSCEFNGVRLRVGIKAEFCNNIFVKNSTFNNTASGVFAQDCGNNMQVTNSTFINMTGPLARGQAVQFNRVSGTGLRINCNYIVNELGKSTPEDAINLCSSSGTAADPIQIKFNYIKGGGPSLTGGGIMTGDCGQSDYALVEGNVVIDPGQYGIAIAGGRYNVLRNNIVYGKQQSFTNVGIYITNYASGICANDTIENNRVWWLNSSGGANPFWNGNTCAGSVVRNNVWQDATVNANMQPPSCTITTPPPPPANVAPTANAGTDVTITLPTANISLTGLASDSDGTIASYKWEKISGPASSVIQSPTSASTTITGLTQGVYVFRFTATDNGGLFASDEVQITVNAEPPPPVIKVLVAKIFVKELNTTFFIWDDKTVTMQAGEK